MDENLHSLKEFGKNIKAMKLLSAFLPKEQRKQLKELESQLDNFIEQKYSLQGTTQGRYLTGGVPPVRFSM